MPKYFPILALVTAAALLLTVDAALAFPAMLSVDVTVTGARDGSNVVGTLRAGTIVDVALCENLQCQLYGPLPGFVPLSAITDPPAGAVPAPPPPNNPAPNNPPPSGGFNLPNFSFNFGIGNSEPPARFEGACFYTSANFRGRSFCAETDDAANRLPGEWNDAISSIEVFGGAEVDVCTDRNLRGTCSTIRRDTSRLPSRINDRISSFEVY